MQGLHVHNQDDHKFTKEFSVTGENHYTLGDIPLRSFLPNPTYICIMPRRRGNNAFHCT